MSNPINPLLCADDPSMVDIINPHGCSPFLLIGDHSGNAIPLALGSLGVADADLQRHIAWDIGVDALGRALAARLDATFIRQHYSRLVIDCNRDPASPDAMPAISDATAVPGNATLDQAAREQRIEEIHAPYHAVIAAALADRPLSTMLVSLHSFTPALAGVTRPWQIGVLHAGHNDGFALRLRDWLMRNAGMIVGDNAPYRMDSNDYTVPRHAFAMARPYVELEIRQDMLVNPHGVAVIAECLQKAFVAAAG